MDTLSALRKHLTRFDVALVIASVVGLVAYFELLPMQHPDSAASFELSEEEAIERAAAFAGQSGLSLSEEEVRAGLERDEVLLDSLQRRLGRPQAVRLLKSEARERLPAYHWRVRWGEEDDEGDVEVRLTVGGAVYSFRADDAPSVEEAGRIVDRKALAYALETERAESSAAPLAERPDSTLARRAGAFMFDLAPSGVESVADTSARLDEAAAVRLARYHLRRTALEGYRFQVDSVWAAPQAGVETATVRLWGDAFHGQRPRVDVKVTATGALLGFEPVFNSRGVPSPFDTAERSEDYREAAREADGIAIGVSGDMAAGILAGVIYVLLVLAALFLFYRRMRARLIDMNAALRDALWGGFFAASLVAVTASGAIFSDVPEFWMGLLAFSMAVAFTGAGGAFLIFLASGAMDSVARPVWPEKLATLDLVRHGALRNVPVGAALLRGLAAAFVLLGCMTVLLVLLPEAGVDFSEEAGSLGHGQFVSVFGFAFATGSWMGLFLGLTVLLGVGTLLYRWRPSAWVVVPGLALVLTLLQVCIVTLQPLGFYALAIAFAALVLAFVFWCYDFITFFVAYLFAVVFWQTSGGWMVEGAPEAVDALLAFAAAGLTGVLALVGLLSGRTSTEVPTYVPVYIKELAEEERLKRDIEIAQQVQQSFLPRRMPQVEGLDLAAMCLAAQEVGGDYYDFIEIAPGKLAIAIGDVSGKGIEAAFFMTLVKGLLQTLAREERPPAEVLRRLNTLFCANVPRGTFISMIYGVMDVEAGTFTFARAGHNPLIHRRSPNGAPRFLRPGGMAIGLTPDARFDAAIEEKSLTLREGDTLVLYTDGVPEAVNVHGEPFGDERLVRTVAAAGPRSAREILRAVSENVHQYVEAAGRHDDMTMVIVKMNRQAAQKGPTEVPAGQTAAQV